MLLRRTLGAVVGLFLIISAAPQDVPAGPARVRRAKPANNTAQRAQRNAPRLQVRSRQARTTNVQRLQNRSANRDPLKNPTHLRQVRTREALMSKHVYNGEPGPGGQVFLNAAFAVLLPVQGVKQREVRAIEYGSGKNSSQRVEVSGIKDGKWRGHLIGTVSVHDMANLDWGPYRKAVDQRIAQDRIQVSYDYGPGTAKTVVAKGVPSKAATAVGIEVPLNKNGITRVIYDRTDANGRVVGASDAYAGRVVEIQWNGN